MGNENKKRISAKTKDALKGVTRGTKNTIKKIIKQREDFLKESLDVALKGTEKLYKKKP